MGSAPDPQQPPRAPRVPEPPEGLTRARWLYVDEARSHEVHAGVRPGAPSEFVVREAAYANVDAEEAFVTRTPLIETWDAKLQHLELETRLSLLGHYWRHDALHPGWTRVRAPPAGASLDLREVGVPLLRGDATFYHFRSRNEDVALVRLPIFLPHGLRFLLARAEFAVPDSATATLSLLHARLAATPARSVVAREHREWATRGFSKLVRAEDFARVHGSDWKQQLTACYGGLLDRMARGQWGAPTEIDAEDAPLDETYTDYAKWLSDPRVAAIHARFLSAEEEAHVLSGGEPFIKQAMARLRAKASRDDQVQLRVLEASLLARDALRSGGHVVDPEVAALVRRFAYYL